MGQPDETDQEIVAWEKTDEALDAAAELMPECQIDPVDAGPAGGDTVAEAGDA